MTMTIPPSEENKDTPGTSPEVNSLNQSVAENVRQVNYRAIYVSPLLFAYDIQDEEADYDALRDYRDTAVRELNSR